MKKQWKQAAAVMMAASMAAGLAGCGGGSETKETQAGKNETAAAGETTAQAEFSYPMEKGEAIQYWVETTPSVTANFANLGDTPFAKGLIENTGVDVEFLQPPQGQVKEQFSLCLLYTSPSPRD